MTTLVLVFLAGGSAMVPLSIPMILRRVKPNYWYRFPTRKTLANEQVWYDGNTYAWLVLAVVVVTLGIGLGTSFRYPDRISL